MDKNTLKKLIEEDKDFVNCKKANNSLLELYRRGMIDNKNENFILKTLALTKEELSAIIESIKRKAKGCD